MSAPSHPPPTRLPDLGTTPGPGHARTSTLALTNATLPFVLQLANKGYRKALADNHHLAAGLNVHRGKVTYEAVARDLGYAYEPVEF